MYLEYEQEMLDGKYGAAQAIFKSAGCCLEPRTLR